MSAVRESGIDEALDGILAAAVDLLDASYGAVIDGGPPAAPWRAVHEHFAVDDLARLEAGIRSARVPERLASAGLPVLIEDLQWAGTVGTGAPVRVLAVPIGPARARAGGLVVAAAGRPRFDEGDSRLLQAAAAAAAIAIRSVALHAQLLRREAWSDASAGIVSALLTGGLEAPLGVMAARVVALAHADAVCILRRDGADEALTVAAGSGPGLPDVGDRIPVRGSITGDAMESLQPRAVAAGMLSRGRGLPAAAPSGPMMVAPMVSVGAAIGVIVVLRHRGAPAFSPAELGLLAGFVGHTTL